MSKFAVFNILLPCMALPCFAATSVLSITPTQMQARIEVQTDQAGFCTYRGSRGATLGVNVPDLTDNGNTDARTGSIIYGNRHVFIMGTRKGNDALAASASYIAGVTCGADAEVTQPFATAAIPWGNMSPELVPFNAARFGNMDYPVIDWVNQSTSYVDPVTGVEFWRLTVPGMMNAGGPLGRFNNTSSTPIDLTGSGKWATIANVVFNSRFTPVAYSKASGGVTDKVFIPLASNASLNQYNGWKSATGVMDNIDDLLVNLFCGNASVGGMTIAVQLTLDGGQTLIGSPITGAACPTTATTQTTYPQATPRPLFRGWGLTSLQHNLVAPQSGTVSVAASVVTLQSPTASGNYFAADWVAGTPIMINGVYDRIASVQAPTQLTITGNPGALTNVPYNIANFGVVIWKVGAGAVDVSLSLDAYTSSIPSSGTNGDTPMVNPLPVSVSKLADGVTLLSPALNGYLTVIANSGGLGSIVLWIPYNADGSVRAETRLLSTGQKLAASARMNANGDTLPFLVTVNPTADSAFTGTDGTAWIATDNTRIFRMAYNEAFPGCAGYPAYNPYPANGGYSNSAAALADDCFLWTNITPSGTSPAMDVRSQIVRGYQTGLVNGVSVGPPHPGFDLGWMGGPTMNLTSGGVVTFYLRPRSSAVPQNSYAEHLAIYAAFDSLTGVLKMVKNMWGGDGDTESRWGGLHAVSIMGGTWRFGAMNNLVTDHGSDGVFLGSMDMPIAKVNRAGFGSAPAWSAAGKTALKNTEVYTCPPDAQMPMRYRLAAMQALGYTGAAIGGSTNCVQIKVTTPPCNATPDPTYVFPDSKTEKDEFPCSTPGFGAADATRSKLMDLQPGDWMGQRSGSGYNEQFVVLSVTYNGTNDIDIWALRFARHNYTIPILGIGQANDDFPGIAPPDGWSLSMSPGLNAGSGTMAIDVSAAASAKWLPDNPARSNCHGVIGAGMSAGMFTYMQPCNPPNYRGNHNTSIASMLFTPFLPAGASYPSFAGSANGVSNAVVQNYNSNTWSTGAANPPYQIDFRHLNPALGSGPEDTTVMLPSLAATRTLSLVGGATRSYLITDPVSAGASDYKRLPLYGFAGHYLLNDVSGPGTSNTVDLPDYSYCRVFKANQCFNPSVVGNLYVTVPRAFVDGNCRSDQYTLPSPCTFQLSPYSGHVTQVRTDKLDASGFTARKLGYLHSIPGLKYQFSNCKPTPDANFAFCVADWLDGVRSEFVAVRLSPMPSLDSVNRTTFVPIAVNIAGIASATNIRARFGYLENGSTLLNCTRYQVSCTTEIPSGTPTDPFSFTDEAVTRQACLNGTACTVTIPAISNRILYYVIDRLDGGGSVVASFPMQVVAVP